MEQFVDTKDRVWRIVITMGAAMRVKAALDIDLLQPEQGDPSTLQQLGTDETRLGMTIAELLRPEFERNQVDETEIYDSFDGETLNNAFLAFYKEWIAFFQRLNRMHRAVAIEKQLAMMTKAMEAETARVERIDVDRVIDQMVPTDDPTDEMIRAMTDGPKSGSSPEKSESTQDL
jgi:hypothetical protein